MEKIKNKLDTLTNDKFILKSAFHPSKTTNITNKKYYHSKSNSYKIPKDLYDELISFFSKNYKVEDIVIVAKSNIPLDELSGQINDAFSDLSWNKISNESYDLNKILTENQPENFTREYKNTFKYNDFHNNKSLKSFIVEFDENPIKNNT